MASSDGSLARTCGMTSYNCMSLCQAGRLDDIRSSRAGNSAACFIQGTCWRTTGARSDLFDLGTHFFIHNGYCNNDCKAGTGILLNKCFITRSNIRHIYDVPEHLRSRICVVHVRSDAFDLLLVSMYFHTPPDTVKAARFATEATDFLDGILCDLPARTTALFGFDLNDSGNGGVFGPYSRRQPKTNA